MRILRHWLLAVLLVATTAGLGAAESVLSFRSRIEVQPDGSLLITEQIRIRADQVAIRHGIYRDFPDLYRDANGLRRNVGFEVVAMERDGRPEPWRTERRANGVRVYAGSASALVSVGLHEYRLTYRTDQQLGFFPDHDELYWNVTGNGWPFTIAEVTAEVVLPGSARVGEVEAYTGPSGARGRNYSSDTPANQPHVATFATTRPLPPYHGLTIVVAWDPGVVERPDLLTKMENAWRANRPAILGAVGLLLALGYYYWAWARVGRDPPKGTIIPLYSPPGLSPGAARYLWRRGYDAKCFAADLIGLAVKGRLKINKFGGGVVSVDQQESRPDLSEGEAALDHTLFLETKQVVFNSLGHERVTSARAAHDGELSQSIQGVLFSHHTGYLLTGVPLALSPLLAGVYEYFGESEALLGLGLSLLLATIAGLCVFGALHHWRGRRRIRSVILGLGALVAALFFNGSLAYLPAYVSPWPVVLGVAGLALVAVCRLLLWAPTWMGRRKLDQLEGFRRYLSVAEKDRLNLENPPERTPELFDRFLPYALALDVEQEWAEQFARVLATTDAAGRARPYAPTWYRGDDFSPAHFARFPTSLGASLRGSIAAAAVAPGTVSGFSVGGGGGGGFSGGGGGGSSGGGGGGGGGGGW